MCDYRIVGGMRLPSQDKPYYQTKLAAFAGMKHKELKPGGWIEFGKQDSRGTPSISFYTKDHCITKQRHFGSSKELLAYVEGFVAARA